MPGRGRPKAGKPDLSEDYDRDREGILANFLLKINNNEDIDTNQIFKVLILQMLRLEKEFKRIDSLESKMNDLEGRVDEIDTEIDNITSKVDSIDTIVESFKDSNDDIKHQIKLQEINLNENKIIIRKLGLEKQAKKFHETKDQTKSVLTNLMKNANMDTNDVKECFRIYPDQNDPGITTDMKKNPPLVIQFKGSFEFSNFMKKLSLIKKVRDFEKIVVDQWVPSQMKEIHDKASKKAYELRKKGKKTKIVISRKGEVLLFSKENKKEAQFEQTEF